MWYKRFYVNERMQQNGSHIVPGLSNWNGVMESGGVIWIVKYGAMLCKMCCDPRCGGAMH